MTYEYKMLQVPPTIVVKLKEARGQEAAFYLQDIVDNYASQGWEFYRVDQIGVRIKPGCMASLMGISSNVTQISYVVTFRRESASSSVESNTRDLGSIANTTAPPPLPQGMLVYMKNSQQYVGVMVEELGEHILVLREDGTQEKYVTSTVEIVNEAHDTRRS